MRGAVCRFERTWRDRSKGPAERRRSAFPGSSSANRRAKDTWWHTYVGTISSIGTRDTSESWLRGRARPPGGSTRGASGRLRRPPPNPRELVAGSARHAVGEAETRKRAHCTRSVAILTMTTCQPSPTSRVEPRVGALSAPLCLLSGCLRRARGRQSG